MHPVHPTIDVDQVHSQLFEFVSITVWCPTWLTLSPGSACTQGAFKNEIITQHDAKRELLMIMVDRVIFPLFVVY